MVKRSSKHRGSRSITSTWVKLLACRQVRALRQMAREGPISFAKFKLARPISVLR